MKNIIGKGWGFPIRFDWDKKEAIMADGVEDIKQSLMILVSTKLGERVMRPRLGCNLDELLFEQLDTPTKAFIRDLVETAIVEYEPRIDLEEVNLSGSDLYGGRVNMEIVFRVRTTNSRFNLVYPFYRNERANGTT